MQTYIVRFWVNDSRIKPSMRIMARDMRDATGQVYALLGHTVFSYSTDDGSVEIRLTSSQITDYVIFVKPEPDSAAG